MAKWTGCLTRGWHFSGGFRRSVSHWGVLGLLSGLVGRPLKSLTMSVTENSWWCQQIAGTFGYLLLQ